MITILGSIVNIPTRDPNDHYMSTGIYNLIMSDIIHMKLKNNKDNSYNLNLDVLTMLY